VPYNWLRSALPELFKDAEARSAQIRAEAQKESAQRAGDHDRARVEVLRRQLEQQRHDHHATRRTHPLGIALKILKTFLTATTPRPGTTTHRAPAK
jgi:hypothetical protein